MSESRGTQAVGSRNKIAVVVVGVGRGHGTRQLVEGLIVVAGTQMRHRTVANTVVSIALIRLGTVCRRG